MALGPAREARQDADARRRHRLACGRSFDVTVTRAAAPEPGRRRGPFFGRPSRDAQRAPTRSIARPCYAMLELSPVKGLKLLPGVRARLHARHRVVGRRARASPRATTSSAASRARRSRAASASSTSRRSRSESIPPFGTPGLAEPRARSTTALGFEQELTKQIELSVEGFYKQLAAARRPDAAETTSSRRRHLQQQRRRPRLRHRAPAPLQAGRPVLRLGRVHALARRAAATPARTPMTSSTTTRRTSSPRSAATGSAAAGRSARASGTSRAACTRPNVGGVYDATPARTRRSPQIPFTGRDCPPFHQLDVRIDKTWTFNELEARRLPRRAERLLPEEPRGRAATTTTTRRSSAVAGLPFLPVIGLRGEL